VPKVLGVVEPVPDQEFIRRVESHELRGILEIVRDMLVQQRADLE
jgi:hypothetical protein